MNELQPTLEEQQSAAPDPIHLSYSKLLRAADNLQSCQRDGDPRVIAVLNQRKGAEELAMARQLGLKMVLAERIVRFKMQSELHVRCYPDFESALREMSQAVKNFRNLIERLPAQGS